ncbi:phosphoenolpyruvate-utilizing N-terminal domain-containing protein [[Eubacterium] cellulosolvens]
MIRLEGIAASTGVAMGRAFLFTHKTVFSSPKESPDTERETLRFKRALEDSKKQIHKLLEETKKKVKQSAKIFDAHLLLLEDSVLTANIIEKIIVNKMVAEEAVKVIIKENMEIFSSMSNPIFQSKTVDIQDVGNRLLKNLSGEEPTSLKSLNEKAVLVANYLTPSDTIYLDKEKVLGFATDEGGLASHTAIIARERRIPAVVGLRVVTENVRAGDQLIIDGVKGLVIINPVEKVLKDYSDR